MNAVLGLKEFVCDLDEQCWALKAESYERSAGTGKSLCVT